MKNKPILITGCARSGTSMTAGIIHLCGAWGGIMSGPNSNNKKGMFENTEIRNNIIKPYLRSIGCDPKGQYPLPDITRYEKIHKDFIYDWKQKIFKVIDLEKDPVYGKYDGKQTWFYKGAKMCLHWPVWHHCFPDAKWIIVRRDDRDIVESCMRTGFMNYYRYREGWYKWISEHKDRFIGMALNGLNFKFVWPERMIMGDFREMKETIEWLGLTWKEEEARKFIQPDLWKAKWKKQKKLNKQMEAERYGYESN